MKVGDEILVKAKVVGLCSPMVINHRTVITGVRVEISEVFLENFNWLDVSNRIMFWIDPANSVLIAEKK